MYISKNFTTKEMGINYNSDPYYTISICQLVYNVLQPLRDILCEPITITSGLRTKENNERVGGIENSQHLYGEAADFTCDNLKKAYDILSKNIKFDQLIYYREKNFIHVSYSNIFNRKQIIIKK